MNTATVTAREFLRNHKEVIDRVRRTKQPAIIVNQKEPQVALMPLEAVEELRRLQQKEALEQMKRLAHEIAEAHKDNPLPSDMAQNHNQYFYEAWEEEQRTKRRP